MIKSLLVFIQLARCFKSALATLVSFSIFQRNHTVHYNKTIVVTIYGYILITTRSQDLNNCLKLNDSQSDSILPTVSGSLHIESFFYVYEISITFISILKSIFLFSIIYNKASEVECCCYNANCKLR